MQMSDVITGVQHVGIPVKDMDATLEFYHKLGFAEAFSTQNRGHRIVFLQLKNLILELYESDNAVGKPGAIDHVALDVTNIETAFADAKRMELHLLDAEIRFLPFWKNGVKFFTILGPNEEKVEFSQML